MRTLRTALLLAGLAALVLILVRVGAGATLASVTRALGWQFLVICLWSAVIMAADTLGWRYAFVRDQIPFLRLMAARVAGEALNAVTALASVGGEAVKVWLLRPDVPYKESVPAVIIGKTTMTIAQAVFLGFGLAIAWTIVPADSRLVNAMLWLIVAEVVGVGGFVLVQVAGVARRAGRLLARFDLHRLIPYAESLDRALQHFYRREWRRLLLSVACYVTGWLLGVIETLLVLNALQVRVSLATATVIEALGSAVRFATFFVPGSLGAMEGANAAAFTALGLSASTGLAFSLVLRARQVIWIVLGFLVLAVSRVRARGNARAQGPDG